jgi:hypothetical protein
MKLAKQVWLCQLNGVVSCTYSQPSICGTPQYVLSDMHLAMIVAVLDAGAEPPSITYRSRASWFLCPLTCVYIYYVALGKDNVLQGMASQNYPCGLSRLTSA